MFSQIQIIGFLSLTTLLAYFWSLSPFTYFTPQFLAVIGLICLFFRHHRLYLHLFLAFFINLIVFSTGGISSPFFFLNYFLLFATALYYQPSTSLAFSLVQILLLSQSLNSLSSFLSLCSLVLISPLSWYISSQRQSQISTDTNFLLWLNLKFKNAIKVIINTTRDPEPDLKLIRHSAQNLLNSADKLTGEFRDDL